MNDAIIGSTGFVGGTLLDQHEFAGRFHSRNIREAAEQPFNTVVCAAAPGSMFEANRFPEQDKARIDLLIGQLSAIRAQQFVLVSSIAVLADCAGQNDETTAAFETDLAYGRNRRALEAFCAGHFGRCLIVRLPALFGRGLKKNFIFDVLNPVPSMLSEARFAELGDRLPTRLVGSLSAFYAWNDTLKMFVIDRKALALNGQRGAYEVAVTELGLSAVGFTHPQSQFQYYDMSRLSTDIALCLDSGLDLVHLAPEPLVAGELFAALTGSAMPPNAARPHREDMWTRHAALFGRSDSYIASAAQTVQALQQFYDVEKAAA